MRHVVELGDDVVQQLGPGKAVLRLDLGRKVAQDNDGRHLGPDEDGADEELKVGEPLVVAICQLSEAEMWLVGRSRAQSTNG